MTDQQAQEVQLEGGTYEIIRKRLGGQGEELLRRLGNLNGKRKQTFGAIENKLVSSARVTTPNNCTPRDMIDVGDKFIFGYNVHMGLRSEMGLSDVFAVYHFKDGNFIQMELDLIGDDRFEKDFINLYKYYKNTVFVKFAMVGPHLFMKFRVGKGVKDIKAFKWLLSDGVLTYIDNRSDGELRYPAQHGFDWKRARRDDFRMGSHPHVSIEDRVFVETIGGDLTIKVENNTDVGSGILEEPVENADQTLDDAEIHYASLGPLILLKILPYQEKAYRFFIYNEKLQKAHRVDALKDACVLLPDDHGLIFSKGYYLTSGEFKEFDNQPEDMLFERRVEAPNGEDFLYVFYNRQAGVYVLLSYNLIEQKVATPTICGGFSLFEDGLLVYFRAESEPHKHHALQIWQTSYVGPFYQPPVDSESTLYKIGNKDIVRGMAECHEIYNLINREEVYETLYLDLVKKTTGMLDSYFWLKDEALENLAENLQEIRNTANGAIEEFEKVSRIQKAARSALEHLKQVTDDLVGAIKRAPLKHIGEFVAFLARLRSLRGEIISSKDRRYVDLSAVETLEKDAAEQVAHLSAACVAFLLEPGALEPYATRIREQEAEIADLTVVSAAAELEEKVLVVGSDLEMLIEIVSNLKIADATQTTRIVEGISTLYADLNRIKAGLRNKKKALGKHEGIAEFNAQMKLIGQGLINFLDVCDEPSKCETYQTKLLVQLEELEARFSEFNEFLLQLTEKREVVYNAFENRRLQLVEARNKKATLLATSAERILKGIHNRVGNLASIDEINGYFAADLMMEKIRDIVAKLQALDDSVKADDLLSRVKTVREDAIRRLRDRQDLFEDGGNLIRLGRHRFSVNTQTLALTVVRRENRQYYHLAGTDFFEEIQDPRFLETRDVWDMELCSENRQVYRGEYLAFCLFEQWVRGGTGELARARNMDETAMLTRVREFMGPRYDEAYAKGVHDWDGTLLLRQLLSLQHRLGPLVRDPRARACGAVFWLRFCPQETKTRLTATFDGLRSLFSLFPDHLETQTYKDELETLIEGFLEGTDIFPVSAAETAAFLFEILLADKGFPISLEADELYRGFHAFLKHKHGTDQFEASLKAFEKAPLRAYGLVRQWVAAFAAAETPAGLPFVDEVAALLFGGFYHADRVSEQKLERVIEGLKGDHALIEAGAFRLNYPAFMTKLAFFQAHTITKFRQYSQLKKELAENFTRDLRLEEFKPRVLSSFVRNQLLDRVYLPLIGDNLAKQIGSAGEQKRTDRMGLLLLVSPPGYGKTTLMEYVANRLGLIFMKINGPAIGHEVTSIDPAAATHASAREELKKLNLALEMGDNIMLYLDDIQHCHPELLQKFISLCDGQRKIEGIYKGRTKTYDFRGKKICVVMAGNPYTESGEKFQIPDMLANRADTYNLGDIIGDEKEAFEMSYIENALTSNPVLGKLAARSQKDLIPLAKMVRTGNREGIQLEGNFSAEEIDEFVAVLEKIFRVRDVILKVNLAYIGSAAQEDAYRVEPPFKLQGSYRNMNKIVEKVLPIMNAEELENLLLSHYQNESQTLTGGAEANLLKFKILMGRADEEDRARWQEIVAGFAKKQRFHGIDTSDKMGQLLAQLGGFGDGLQAIEKSLSGAMARLLEQRSRNDLKQVVTQTSLAPETLASLSELLEPMLTLVEQNASSQPAAAEISPEEAKALLQVVGQQFEIMHHWLRPIQASSKSHGLQLKQLQGAVKASLGTHATILDYLKRLIDHAGPKT